MQIKSAEFIISNSNYKKCPEHSLPEFAFVGRSNVGKSSLINMLTNRKKLAKTSGSPGKTLLINHFLIDGLWYLVDLPGYGYASIPVAMKNKLRSMLEQYIVNRDLLTQLFILIDSRHKPMQVDIDFINWVGKHQIPFAIVFTKADKTRSMVLKSNIEAWESKLFESWAELPPFFLTSSLDGVGKDDLLQHILTVNKQLKL